VRLPAAAVGVVAVLTLVGCSGPAKTVSISGGPGPSLSKLIAKADLAPCPPSSATAVSGGLPNLTLDCLGAGPAIHLAGLKGPAVVNVWGSWCVPCQGEATYLSSAYDADRGKVTFLGVDTEDESDSALDFGAHVKPPVRYPSVVDPDKKVLIGLAKSPGPPETAFVGAGGKVVHVHIGAYTSTAQLQTDIATYLDVR
jgi:thiol-disulfide isomerase/thioredoxin